MNLRAIDAGSVGRPRLFAKQYGRNPIFPEVAYALRQAKFAYYGVTTSTALTVQTMFISGVGQVYTPAGGAQTTLTGWHTNLQQGRRLPNPERLYVRGLALSLDPNTLLADAKRWVRDTLVTFSIGSNTVNYWQTHAFKLPAGGGLSTASVGVVGVGMPLADAFAKMWGPPMVVGPVNNGVVRAIQGDGGPLTVDSCEIIEQDQNFAVTFDPTQVSDAGGNTTYTTSASGVGINVHCYLEGVWVRGVQ